MVRILRSIIDDYYRLQRIGRKLAARNSNSGDKIGVSARTVSMISAHCTSGRLPIIQNLKYLLVLISAVRYGTRFVNTFWRFQIGFRKQDKVHPGRNSAKIAKVDAARIKRKPAARCRPVCIFKPTPIEKIVSISKSHSFRAFIRVLILYLLPTYDFAFYRILSEARELKEFPNLNGTSALEILRLDRASIFTVPSNLCKTCPKLKSL